MIATINHALDLPVLKLFERSEDDFKDRIYEKLMARVETDHQTGCMIFTGAWTSRGVGRVRVGHLVFNITRVAAWIFRPDFNLFSQDFPYRTCTCPACFSHEHIRVARSRRDMFAAMKRHGAIRVKPGIHRLNFEKAHEIRALALKGMDPIKLSTQFRVQPETIQKVLRGETWNEAKRKTGPALGSYPWGMRAFDSEDAG